MEELKTHVRIPGHGGLYLESRLSFMKIILPVRLSGRLSFHTRLVIHFFPTVQTQRSITASRRSFPA